MANLLRFMRSVLVVCLIALALCWGLYFAIRPDPSHFFASSIRKLELLRMTSSPRIILAGGSNIAMGVDSAMLERELGMPVVNFALQVRLGVAPLEELREHIRPGDVIVLSLEYYNFTSEEAFFGQQQALADWIEFAPGRIRHTRHPVADFPSVFTIILQRKINRQLNYLLYGNSLDTFRGVFTGEGFDERGDFVGHLDDHSIDPDQIEASQYPLSNLESAYEYLDEFNQYANARGARVFYEPQANRSTNCELTGLSDLKQFYRRLEKNTSIPVLPPLNALCLPDDHFYDTPYHLNGMGRAARTSRLIEDLRAALGLPASE